MSDEGWNFFTGTITTNKLNNYGLTSKTITNTYIGWFRERKLNLKKCEFMTVLNCKLSENVGNLTVLVFKH
jgi:hypothetical protein